MIVRRRGVVLKAERAHADLVRLVVAVGTEETDAVAYTRLVGPVGEGDHVLLNTTAVELGLGTGGVHFVMAVEGEQSNGSPEGREMKLRYTPMQTSFAAVEDRYRDAIDAVEHLAGLPVVAAGLHSAIAPVVLGAWAAGGGPKKIALVHTDGGAMPIAFSETVEVLRARGLVATTITAGQAFGGDLEAVNLYSALAAAEAVAEADLVVVAMGPGNLGTGSRWGFALMEVAQVVNAAVAMGGRAIVVPRISFADPRDRHRGVSHHTLTALGRAALGHARIALPRLEPDRAAVVREQLRTLEGRHEIVEVDLGPAEEALARSPVPLSSMGRTFADDPDCFRAAAAAGVLAVGS